MLYYIKGTDSEGKSVYLSETEDKKLMWVMKESEGSTFASSGNANMVKDIIIGTNLTDNVADIKVVEW